MNNKVVAGKNVAFKVTYNDNNWQGICSNKIASYNFKTRIWCKKQSITKYNCQSDFWKKIKLDKNTFPCFDSVSLLNNEPSFYAGHYHGKEHSNEPIRSLYIKPNKIAIFTSRNPEDPESQRFIFFIGIINDVKTFIDKNGNQFNTYHCEPETGIIFKNIYPKYWDFYSNRNNPNRFAWNTGLFRYWSDEQVKNLLEWVSSKRRYTKKNNKKAEFLLKHFFK